MPRCAVAAGGERAGVAGTRDSSSSRRRRRTCRAFEAELCRCRRSGTCADRRRRRAAGRCAAPSSSSSASSTSRDAQILDARRPAPMKPRPEVAQHVPASGSSLLEIAVELLFEPRGEIVFDVAARRSSPGTRSTTRPLSSRMRRFFSSAHVAAVAAAPAGSRRRSRAGRCRALPCA